MQNFYIGLSGFNAAQRGLEVIGNNIANSATEGYHRQELNLAAALSLDNGGVSIGGGVEVAGVRRMVDNLLEQKLLLQTSTLSDISRQLSSMSSIENAMGEITTDGGLNSVIDDFFISMSNLSAHSDDLIYQNDLVSKANTLAEKFNNLGSYLSDVKYQIRLETEQSIEEANNYIDEIAKLNDQIGEMVMTGGDPNNLIDKRGQYITELAKLVPVQMRSREDGFVDVTVSGFPVVMGPVGMHLTSSLNSDEQLGVGAKGAFNLSTDLDGGSIGGMLSVYNNFVVDVQNGLDRLAAAISTELNNIHVQGVSSNGSFEELTGESMKSENLADFGSAVTDGYIYLRVTNKSTGEITRTAIAIDAANDSFSDIAAAISAVDGVSSSFVNTKLRIEADSGYEFDFSPAVISEPSSSGLTGNVPEISASGIYTGASNETFTFTVSGTGEVGNGTLQLEVKNSNGDTLNVIDVGSGYSAGDEIEVADGIKISFGVGELNSGESFTVDVYADTDTSGLLTVAGLNTFFSGTTASSIKVCARIAEDPTLIATSVGQDMSDNNNALKMAGLSDANLGSINNLSPGDYYKQLVADIGQDVSIKQTQQESCKTLVNGLVTQRGEVGGVDINEEAAQIVIFEQMIQATAKYMNIIHESLTTIMEMV